MATPTTRVVATALVGRDQALEVLEAAWQDATRGRLRIVVVEGEPGTGKSTLARWAADRAEVDGAAVGTGTAHELAGAPPYWPWISALRGLAAHAGVERVRSAIRDTPGAEVVGAFLDGGAAEPSVTPFQLFDAVGRVLERLAAPDPVLVVLDDLQWADQASLDLLQFLARAHSPARVLVVAATRPPAVDEPLAASVAALATESTVRRLKLGPLGVDDVRRMVERLSGAPVDPAIAAAITAGTGGNPFFVEELVRELAVGGTGVDVARAAVPDSVRAAVRARAARLGARAVEVMTLVSFSGTDFDDVVAPRVLDLDARAVQQVLEGASRDGLVVEVDGRPGTYRFVHDIVRHAFYDAVPQRRRAETHVAIARTLVELLGDRADRRASELATHFAQGIDVGGAAEAVHWLRQAAAQAMRAQAYIDAIRHLRRALFVVRSRLGDERRECEVLIELAAAARFAADPATAQLARERAHRLAVRLGDDALALRASNVLLGPGAHWVRRAR